MSQNYFKLISLILVFTACFFITNIVSANVVTRFVTTGTMGWQSYDSTVRSCGDYSYNSYVSQPVDYWGVDNTDLPDRDSVTSVDYCIRGTGNLIASYSEAFGQYVYGTDQTGAELCVNLPIASLNPGNNHDIWYPSNAYAFRGGAADSDSTLDCMYVKINTSTPTLTPTNTPAPANTPIPTPTLTAEVLMEEVPTPINTPTLTNTPTPFPILTPVPTSTPTTAASGGGGGGGTSMPSAPVCNDQKPGGAPVLLLAVSSGSNSITLNWVKANDPVSYYLVTFGTKPGEQLYGNPNVGGSNTTSYTIDHLSGGKNYYFKVRAGNGCMPGDYSNEVIGRLTGGFITGVPGGFSFDVLGASIGPNGQTSPRLPSAGYPPQLGFFQRVWGFVRGIFGR